MEENTVHPMQLMPRKRKPSTTSTRLSTHMKKPTLNWGEHGCQQHRQARCAAEGEVVGRLEPDDAQGRQDQPHVQQQEKGEVCDQFFLFESVFY